MKHHLLFPLLVTASACCGLAVFYRAEMAGGGLIYFFLLWNLLLAWVPYLASLCFAYWAGRRAPSISLVFLGALWLLFLPNAPYIITDFVHFRHLPPVPIWYDIFLLFSAASTGLVLGLVSLATMHHALQRLFSATTAWAIVLAAIPMSGFGVWLGRFKRWNSWDILSRPEALLEDILRIFTTQATLKHALQISGLLSVILLFAYLLLYNFAAASTHEK